MNHIRPRYALELLLKKIKFSPVVLIQGPRQTGKSFLVKNLLPDKIKKEYRTLDLASVKMFASENPDTFIRENEPETILIIDEAQKVPLLFDSIKAYVDEKRVPGQFILLGSTEFSKLTNISESLTGRATRLKVFPLTLAESRLLPLNITKYHINEKPRVTRVELLKYLKNGGMPGLFGIKNEAEKFNALKDWIDLTAHRDSLNFKNVKIESDLILRILSAISFLEDTSIGSIGKYLRVDVRKIKTHINVLSTLFVVNRIDPYPNSTGKPQYFFCDVGFLGYFQSTFEKKLKTFVVQEFLAQLSYMEHDLKKIYFYRSSKGRLIDLIVCKNESVELVIKIFAEEQTQSKQYELLRSFKERNLNYINDTTKLIALTGSLIKIKCDDIIIYPWESIA